MKKIIASCIVVIAVIFVACLALHMRNGGQSVTTGQKPPLRLAVLLPLTGPGASGAASSRDGFELALDQIRAKGGHVEVLYEDTQTNPRTAVSIYQRLQASPSPPHVYVPQLSSVMKALRPLLSQTSLTVCTGVSTPGVADPSRSIFRVFLSADAIGGAAADWAKAKEVRHACVVYVDDEYGKACLDGFSQGFQGNGRKVSSEPFSIIEKDFRNQWQRLLSEQPDSVFVAGYGPGYIAVLNQLRERGFTGKIIVDWSITAPEYMKATGGVRDGTAVVTVEASTDFIKEYQQKYGKYPSIINAGFSYDTMMTVWHAYETSDGSPSGMARAILTSSECPGAMRAGRVNTDGDVSVQYSVVYVRNGQISEGR